MSTIKATIDQATLNVALGKISASGTRQESGKVLLVPYSVTVHYHVDDITAEIQSGHLAANANVHIEVKGFNYTKRTSAVTDLVFEGKSLVIRVTSLKLPVEIQLPAIGKLSLGTIDLCQVLKTPMEVRFAVLQENYPIALPNGQSLYLTLDTPALTMTPGQIEVVAQVKCS